MRPQLVKAAALGAALALTVSLGPHAGAGISGGSLDDSFSKDGKTRIAFGPFGVVPEEWAGDLVLYRGRKIVFASAVHSKGRNNLIHFGLTRHHADGRPDDSFGGNGRVTTSFGGQANDVHVARYGPRKIVAAGLIDPQGDRSGGKLALARYRGDGSRARSFGEEGKVTTDIVFVALTHLSVVDGKIVVAGWSSFRDSVDGSPKDVAKVVRYEADGTLDETFGDGGQVVVELPWENEHGGEVIVDRDQRIVVAGTSNEQNCDCGGFSVARYNSDGSPDETFGGGDGYVETGDSADDATAHDVMIQPDGRIVVGGRDGEFDCTGCGARFHLQRFTSDGQVDPTFGRDGAFTAPSDSRVSAFSTILSLALQPDGKILAGGFSQVGFPQYSHRPQWRIDRYTANGALDPTFDGDGNLRTQVGVDHGKSFYRHHAAVVKVALYPNERIIAAGWTNVPADEEGDWRRVFAFARYHR